MRTFQLTVAVDQGNIQPTTVVTEPPLEGRPLAAFNQWIGDARRELKDGTYVLTLGAAEDGVRGEGPDKRSLDILRRKLVTPMGEVQDDLTAAFAFQDLDDDTFVADTAAFVARGISLSLVFLKPDRFVPGFLRLQVAGSADEIDRSIFQDDIDTIASLEIPVDDEAALRERTELLGKAAAQGIVPRPVTGTRGPLQAYIAGIGPRNVFAKPANAKLQARVDRLAPQIEAAVMRGVVDQFAGSHERTGATLAALRGSFNLG